MRKRRKDMQPRGDRNGYSKKRQPNRWSLFDKQSSPDFFNNFKGLVKFLAIPSYIQQRKDLHDY